MKWEMQINVGNTDPPTWKSVRPTGGHPYVYDTEEEAAHMLNTCYPDQCREDRLGGQPRQTRIVEVNRFEFMHLSVRECVSTRVRNAPDHHVCEVLGCEEPARRLEPLVSPDGRIVEILLCARHYEEVELW